MTIIPVSDISVQAESWQSQLRNAVRDIDTLVERLGLDPDTVAVNPDFPLLVPQAYLNKIRIGDRYDPLLLQVLPLKVESQTTRGFLDDPLLERRTQGKAAGTIGGTTDLASSDLASSDLPFSDLPKGLIQKYQGRVLVVTTGACAINCRYCFRRHFPYRENQPDSEDWTGIVRHLSKDKSISEVILSGGDPLVLSDARLGKIIDQLETVPHLDTLRIHTRLPVVLPARITKALVNRLSSGRLRTVIVIHANHANEIGQDVAAAFALLQQACITILNQSVLLAGVNDNVQTLEMLSRRLWEAGVLPYYLHLLDRVSGAAHFEVSEVRAVEIMAGLSASLSGYLVPRLVREVPGKTSKQLIFKSI